MKTWGKKYILEEEKGNAKALKSQRKLLILMTRKSGPCAFSEVPKPIGWLCTSWPMEVTAVLPGDAAQEEGLAELAISL